VSCCEEVPQGDRSLVDAGTVGTERVTGH